MGQCCSSEETKTTETVQAASPEPAPAKDSPPPGEDPKLSPSPVPPKIFAVSYQKADHPKVGLDIQQVEKKTLVVKKIKDGPVTNHNKDATDKVEEGDHIVSVNGVAGDSEAMLNEIKNGVGLINLSFTKGPPLVGGSGIYAFVNQWNTQDSKPNTLNAHPDYTVDMSAGQWSAEWIFSPVAGSSPDTFNIRNRWSGDQGEWSWYLNLDSSNNVTLYGNPDPSWDSTKWEKKDAGGGWFRYENVWKRGWYLNVAQGQQKVEVYQNPPNDWGSAMWKRVETS